MSGSAFDEAGLREQIPRVVSALVSRGAPFAAAEDAVQSALVRALVVWERDPPGSPTGWLITTAWRAFLDQNRSDAARASREHRDAVEPPAGSVPAHDDTLWLYFLCAHPTLSPSSAVALTLRAVAGLTTGQIAEAYLVPESTMAQRISRAKKRLADVRLDRPGSVTTVLRVLYLVFNEGYAGDVDLSAEAIRLMRQLVTQVSHPEVSGLLALMLLHHARRATRTGPGGRLVPLAEQDRGQWDTALIAEGISILQRALARDQRGEYQMQAAIAALHADAPRAEETDWPQIVAWYEELWALTGSEVVALNRAVAVGEADGPEAGLAALADLSPETPRYPAVSAYLHESAGCVDVAAVEYAEAARRATSEMEQAHLARQAARLKITHHTVEGTR